MAVHVDGGVIRLEGECGVEDAETLVTAMAAEQNPRIDLALCRQLHGAVVQALLVFRPSIDVDAADGFLNAFVLPALKRSAGAQPAALRNEGVWNQ